MKKLFQKCLFPVLVLGCAAAVGGCGKPRIDARDPETYRKSLASMRKSLSADERNALEQAVEKIFRYERKRSAEYGSTMGDAGIMLLLDGLTAEEIIARAKTIRP